MRIVLFTIYALAKPVNANQGCSFRQLQPYICPKTHQTISPFYFNFPLVDEIKTSQPPAAPPTLSPSLMNCQGFESFSGKHMEYEEPNSLQQIGVTKYLQTLIVLFRLLSLAEPLY